MTIGIADRIRAFAVDAVAPGRLPSEATGLVAVGWATVELERAVPQLAAALGVDSTIFVAAAGSTALGARGLIATGILEDGLSLIAIEPSTEGRTAAALARWDEGPIAAWYAPTVVVAQDPGRPWRDGPFGPERIVGGDPLTGPHRLLVVVGTGTIPA